MSGDCADEAGGCLVTRATPKRVMIIILVKANALTHHHTFLPQAHTLTT